MITVDEIVGWWRWAAEAGNDQLRARREERVRKRIFPDDLSFEEVEERRALIVEAQKQLEGDFERDDPMPDPQIAALEIAPFPALKWEGLVPKTARAHMRGSIHDGTAAEVRHMRNEAQGSPFDVDLPAPKTPLVKKR